MFINKDKLLEIYRKKIEEDYDDVKKDNDAYDDDDGPLQSTALYSTLVRLEQFLNAPHLIEVTELGMVTLVSFDWP